MERPCEFAYSQVCGNSPVALLSRINNFGFPPAWLSLTAAVFYSGLSRTVIYRHIDADNLVTSTVKLPGCKRGRLLISRESLDHLIETGIGQRSCDNTRQKKSQPQNHPKGAAREKPQGNKTNK